MRRNARAPAPPALSRPAILRLLGGTLAVATTSRALHELTATPGETGDAPHGGDGPVAERRYRGTATTTVGGDRFSGSGEPQSLEHDVTVTVAPSKGGNGAPPFELTVGRPADLAPATGPGGIAAAAVSFGPGEGRTVDRCWEV